MRAGDAPISEHGNAGPHRGELVLTADHGGLLQSIAVAEPEIAAPGGVPAFVGLSMREALVRAHAEGWDVRVDGAGYVLRQEPAPGAVPADRTVTLHFGSNLS